MLMRVNKTCNFTNNFLLFIRKYCENEIIFLLLQAQVMQPTRYTCQKYIH